MKITENSNAEPIIMCDPTLIQDIKLTVDIERLPVQFSTADIAEWMKTDNIKKLDGTAYPEITHEQLTNYSLHTPITKKENKKYYILALTVNYFHLTLLKCPVVNSSTAKTSYPF